MDAQNVPIKARKVPGMNDALIDMDALLQEKKSIERAAKLHWLHWVVIGLSLLLTFGAWYFTKQQVDEKVSNRFAREADQVAELIYERMQKYEDALWGGVAAIHSQSFGIDYEEWKRFSDTLQIEKKYPGINGIGVIHYVTPESMKSYLELQHLDRPDYKIHPPHEKNEYWPITYIEPVETNAAAVGLDIAHETNRHTAAVNARDSGEAQITGPIFLVQDAQKTPGFLFYAPFYRGGTYSTEVERQKNFVGMVYAPFVFKKLMAGTLEKEKRHVGIQITDGDTDLYNEHTENEKDFDPNPLFKKQFDVSFYGRMWNFDIWSAKSFRKEAGNNKPMTILLGGLMIDAMLLAIFILLSRSNRRAINFANHMTEGYQSKEKELEDIVEKLSDSNEELERFAYIAAHDLQEPLRMVTSFSQLLKEKYESTLDDKAKEYLGFCVDGAARMKALVDDLLEYSRITNDVDTSQDVDCSAIMDVVLDNLSERIQETKSEISVGTLPVISGNPVRFTRLIQNLVCNAIKYQNPGNVPKIHVDVTEKQDEWIFSVKDNGIGIKEEYQQQIFSPFKRLHTNQEYIGTGIGLAVCKKIVEMKGGRLWVESNAGEGSIFYFLLPKADIKNKIGEAA